MAGRYTKLIRTLGHQKWFAATGRRLVPVDRWIHYRTGGRLTILGPEVLPSLVLTTTGRKSGLPRSVPLIYAEHDGGYIVTASNWGQDHHPAWSANLLANPQAEIELHGEIKQVTATLAEGADRHELWSAVTQVWPAYDTYAARSGHDLRVFLLRPTRG
jgi:deazaflavin-dependent oxidoreductase (nitroreductase family)